ncbi:hypothetical protein RDI58_022504 [Solanum bulbocastanum]|uniref:TF-B3 domain-containing protein n=1 Tax=Solanum bulbocastanum TaxID=147425 RepID=A0AAN8T267_SOLBU
MASRKTKVIEDQEDNSTIKKLRTGSLHINDCKLSGSIKNVCEMKECNEESNGIVLDPEDRTTYILNEKSDQLTKSRSANGLQLPGKEVREKLLPHISAPTLGEAKHVILVDHQGQEWNMLLVCQNEDVYFLKRHWYDYADVYNLAVSDTVVIERIMKQQVKEDLDFAAVSEIGDHDWDTIFPPNSTWQIEQVNTINAEDVEEQTEIKDIGKVEVVVVM